MGRLLLEHKLKLRNGIWYYTSPVLENHWKSTGVKKYDGKKKAIAKGKDLEQEYQQHASVNMTDDGNPVLKDYGKDFYIVGKCKRLERLKLYGTEMSLRYCKDSRHRLEEYVFKDKIGDMRVRNITKKDVRDFQFRLSEKKSAFVVNDTIKTLSTLFSELVLDEILDRNPCDKLEKIKENPKQVVPLTREEADKLYPVSDIPKLLYIWNTYGDFLTDFIEFNTGMRNGEVRALKWKHINLETNEIYVETAIKDKIRTKVGTTKGKYKRIAPICSILKKAIVTYKNNYVDSRFLNDDSFLFCDENGLPFSETKSYSRHIEAFERVGIPYRKQHANRHTYGTTLKEMGISDEDIRTTSGWRS